MKILWELYRSFFVIGGLTFGGGYAMLPMLQRELVDNKKWVTNDDLLNYFAIGQCTPGVIAVNTATLVGYRMRKVPGAIAGTLGVISPSIIIITVIAAVLENFMDILWVQQAFAGIRVAVCALILSSVVKLCKSNIKHKWQLIPAVGALALSLLGASPVIVVALCIVGSLFLGRKVKSHG
ncbi:MAG: chromate transporter [Clostridiales bacterium]|nr:chromate transporter [Clostridiales bacterium]